MLAIKGHHDAKTASNVLQLLAGKRAALMHCCHWSNKCSQVQVMSVRHTNLIFLPGQLMTMQKRISVCPTVQKPTKVHSLKRDIRTKGPSKRLTEWQVHRGNGLRHQHTSSLCIFMQFEEEVPADTKLMGVCDNHHWRIPSLLVATWWHMGVDQDAVIVFKGFCISFWDGQMVVGSASWSPITALPFCQVSTLSPRHPQALSGDMFWQASRTLFCGAWTPSAPWFFCHPWTMTSNWIPSKTIFAMCLLFLDSAGSQILHNWLWSVERADGGWASGAVQNRHLFQSGC